MKRARLLLARAWALYCLATGLLFIACLIGMAVIFAFSSSGPVVGVVGTPREISTRVPYKGSVTYAFDARRFASCPGTVVTTLRSITNHGPPAVVTFQRPVSSVDIRETDNVHVAVQLSEAVFPGRWLYQSSVDSQCPTYRRTDPLVRFEIEVFLP